MPRMLILARGDARTFRDVDGRSLLADLPFAVTVFGDRGNSPMLRALEGDFELEVVRWYAPSGIVARAVELHAASPFTAVATFDENLVELAAEIRSRLGIPGMASAQAELFRNKIRMKEVLSRAGVRTPHCAHCSDHEAVQALLAAHGALVIKPVSGFGARDVEFIRTRAELEAWYGSGKPLDEFEAEEWIDGVLYHVNAVVRDGAPLLTASAVYLPGMGNIDFSAGTPFVSVMVEDPELRTRLEHFSDSVIAHLGMLNGVTHLECFVTQSGEIVFCEVGARPGGGGIVWMIEAQYGVNYNRALLLLEGGRGDLLALPASHRSGVAGLVGFRSERSAFIESAAVAEDFKDDWIHISQVDVGKGAFKAASSHCTDFLGLLVFSSLDTAQFQQRRQHLSERFYSALQMRPI